MDWYLVGIAAGFAVAVFVFAVVKRRSTRSMSVAEQAEYLSGRRARMLPALAVIFLSQQVTYFSTVRDYERVATVKISAWLVLSIVLLASLVTKGFWFHPKQIRDLIDDENTRANRNEGIRWGFIVSMATAIAIETMTMFDHIKARESIHIILSSGLVVALIRWGYLERRALRDG
ncbi:MAG TPA: hypothetical protein VIL42_04515 [Sphingomicrobium sp.]|jgi:hypothetical protein